MSAHQDTGNKRIVIVGTSGSGKTTLFNFLTNSKNLTGYNHDGSDITTEVCERRHKKELWNIIDTPGYSYKDEDKWWEIIHSIGKVNLTLFCVKGFRRWNEIGNVKRLYDAIRSVGRMILVTIEVDAAPLLPDNIYYLHLPVKSDPGYCKIDLSKYLNSEYDLMSPLRIMETYRTHIEVIEKQNLLISKITLDLDTEREKCILKDIEMCRIRASNESIILQLRDLEARFEELIQQKEDTDKRNGTLQTLYKKKDKLATKHKRTSRNHFLNRRHDIDDIIERARTEVAKFCDVDDMSSRATAKMPHGAWHIVSISPFAGNYWLGVYREKMSEIATFMTRILVSIKTKYDQVNTGNRGKEEEESA